MYGSDGSLFESPGGDNFLILESAYRNVWSKTELLQRKIEVWAMHYWICGLGKRMLVIIQEIFELTNITFRSSIDLLDLLIYILPCSDPDWTRVSSSVYSMRPFSSLSKASFIVIIIIFIFCLPHLLLCISYSSTFRIEQHSWWRAAVFTNSRMRCTGIWLLQTWP